MVQKIRTEISPPTNGPFGKAYAGATFNDKDRDQHDNYGSYSDASSEIPLVDTSSADARSSLILGARLCQTETVVAVHAINDQ